MLKIWGFVGKLRQLMHGVVGQLALAPMRYAALRSRDGRRFQIRSKDVRLKVFDSSTVTSFDRHYVYHVAWALRVLHEGGIKDGHLDISSSVFFAATASAFLPVQFYDYRPADLVLSGLSCGRADLLQLPFSSNSIRSLSCMHVIEHVGLARYGDKFDPCADERAICELRRVLAVGGQLLLVVPIAASPYIAFNAHRVYSYNLVMQYFSDYELLEFALIPESSCDGGLIRFADPSLIDGQHYACGCFHFKKVHS